MKLPTTQCNNRFRMNSCIYFTTYMYKYTHKLTLTFKYPRPNTDMLYVFYLKIYEL